MVWRLRGALILLIVAVCSGAHSAADLQITAQGFAINTAQQAQAGQFESVRVRIEAPQQIATLEIAAGDLETDLATTTDRSLFALFGLAKRPMHAFDVTLDFAPFFNDRFAEPGTYQTHISVVDRKGERLQATLTAVVIGQRAAKTVSTAETLEPAEMQETDAVFQRQGSGDVEYVGASGLTWFTIEPVDVTIRLRATDADAKLHQLAQSSWDLIATREDLLAVLTGTPTLPYVDIPTARGAAAGIVISLSDSSGDTLIRLTGSTTAVSPAGTTVTLMARIRR